MQIVLTSCCVHEGKLEITKFNFQKFELIVVFHKYSIHTVLKNIPHLLISTSAAGYSQAGVQWRLGVRSL